MSHVSIRDPPRIVSNRERTTNIYDGGNLPNDKLSQTTYESLTRTYAKKKDGYNLQVSLETVHERTCDERAHTFSGPVL